MELHLFFDRAQVSYILSHQNKGRSKNNWRQIGSISVKSGRLGGAQAPRAPLWTSDCDSKYKAESRLAAIVYNLHSYVKYNDICVMNSMFEQYIV